MDQRGQTSLTIQYPWVVAFAFGLLHGFGFASGLKATGLPQADIALALLLFNVGVELGQVFFVFLILGMARSYRALEIRWPRWALALPGYTVGTLGAYWTIQRTAMLLGSSDEAKIDKTTAMWLVLLVVLAAPSSAWAHIQAGEGVSGVHHPVSGWDHVLAMIAVGLWGAQLGRPAVWLLPVTFPMVMALGAMLGLLGIPLPGVEIGIALSAIVLGAMVLAEKRPPVWVAVVIVGVFAIFHGHAHGTELPAGQSGLLYSMGFVMATGCLHGVGILIGLIHHWAAGRVFLRVAGATVAVAGILFLYSALT